MAVHDHDRRTPRDYIHNARSRYEDTGSGGKWLGFLIGLAILAFLGYMLFATPNNDTGDAVRQTPQNPTTTTAPPTTSPPSDTTTTAPSTK